MGGTSSWSSEVWDAAAFGTHPGGEEQRFMFVLEGGSKSSASVKHFSKVSLENEVQVSMSSKFEIVSKEFGKPFDILGIKLDNHQMGRPRVNFKRWVIKVREIV